MLKIPKGLKKKKKGKKGKHKGDDDLFTPEELEEYKRQKALREQQEHQEAEAPGEEGAEASSASASSHSHEHSGDAPAPAASGAAPEDEDRLQALLGGVDSILNKTQRDLERIKQTSFFQRKPTPSELESKRAAGPPGRPAAPSAAATAAAAAAPSKKGKKRWVGFEGEADDESEDEHLPPVEQPTAAAAAAAFEPEPEQPHEEEEEESEEEDEGDDIFDTSYIDVITSGEVKLAYIPDSPTEQPDDGDDPFDTAYAAKVIGNDEDIKKRQKLEKVSLGIAVDVLTGKAAPPSKPPPLPENAVAKRAVPRRVKPVDLLKLGSFDDGSTPAPEAEPAEGEQAQADAPKSILEDDELLGIPDDLPPVGTPIIPPASIVPTTPVPEEKQGEDEEKKEEKQIDLSEFDVIAEKPVVNLPVSNLALVAAALGGPPAPEPEEVDDELEDEFAALAQESLLRKKEEEDEFAVDGDDPFDTTAAAVLLGEPDEPAQPKPAAADVDVLLAGPQASWSAFDEDEHERPHLKPSRPPPPRPAAPHAAATAHEDADVDPFDTSFAHNILPGKTELKLIEKEILHDHNEARILSHSDSDFDFNPREGEEPKPQQPQVSFYVTDPQGDIDHSPVVHRDLLGGSTSDLSALGHDPLPADAARTDQDDDAALHDDPFDTSAVEAVAVPGKTELRYLEKEILGDVTATPAPADHDDDFDPRADEAKKAARPDVLPGVPKSVAFALPSPAQDLLVGGEEAGSKFSKPLTPYYADQAPAIATEVDPFDTSIAGDLAPGRAELKVLESELVDGSAGIKASLSDENFDPRAGGAAVGNAEQDLFKVEEGVGHRPLTPAVQEEAEVDPFDTSIASNIAPGKAELKVLENELITNDPQPSIKRTYTDPDFNPRDEPAQPAADLLNEPAEHVPAKPLTPVLGEQSSLDNIEDDVDPFDTSIAADLGPGKTELRILESELIGRQ